MREAGIIFFSLFLTLSFSVSFGHFCFLHFCKVAFVADFSEAARCLQVSRRADDFWRQSTTRATATKTAAAAASNRNNVLSHNQSNACSWLFNRCLALLSVYNASLKPSHCIPLSHDCVLEQHGLQLQAVNHYRELQVRRNVLFKYTSIIEWKLNQNDHEFQCGIKSSATTPEAVNVAEASSLSRLRCDKTDKKSSSAEAVVQCKSNYRCVGSFSFCITVTPVELQTMVFNAVGLTRMG